MLVFLFLLLFTECCHHRRRASATLLTATHQTKANPPPLQNRNPSSQCQKIGTLVYVRKTTLYTIFSEIYSRGGLGGHTVLPCKKFYIVTTSSGRHAQVPTTSYSDVVATYNRELQTTSLGRQTTTSADYVCTTSVRLHKTTFLQSL